MSNFNTKITDILQEKFLNKMFGWLDLKLMFRFEANVWI